MKIAKCKFSATALLCLAAFAGFARAGEDLETTYGRRSGRGAMTSVNGTAVLAKMFEEAGHKVTSWEPLSPRVKEADVIVWFPDDFHAPSAEVRTWLETWLGDRPGRTLIYVGRDFDAAPWYWEKVKARASTEDLPAVQSRLDAAKAAFESAREVIPDEEFCPWFKIDGQAQPRKVHTLEGEWADDLDQDAVEIELVGRLPPLRPAKVLLESEGDKLVSRIEIGKYRNQLLVVTNGSFLLNAMLVNHEHRKLAGKLIEAVGRPPKDVVFLETAQPQIRQTDPQWDIPTGLEATNYYPMNWILLHFAAVGIILCFWRWPIFGRPLPSAPPGTSDFGKHVDALAGLLRRSRDRAFAMARLKQYRQKIKKE